MDQRKRGPTETGSETVGNGVRFTSHLLPTFAELNLTPFSDGKATPTTESLFDYGLADSALDKGALINNSYGHPFTRAGGALQAVGGGISAGSGVILAAGGIAACPESLGGGCAVAVGGTALSIWGVDQTQAGIRTMWNGTGTQTIGGYALQQAFGISPQAAELLYGAAGVAGGASVGALATDIPTLSTVKVYAPIASASADAEAGGTSAYAGQYNLQGKIIGQHDMITNPGPLADLTGTPAANFASGQYTSILLLDDTTLYRAGDSTGKALGQWFTTEPPSSIANVRIDSAVQAQWINNNGILEGQSPINAYFTVKIPSGTTVYTGPVGYQGGVYLGGQEMNQIFILTPWKTPGVEVVGKPVPLQ